MKKTKKKLFFWVIKGRQKGESKRERKSLTKKKTVKEREKKQPNINKSWFVLDL